MRAVRQNALQAISFTVACVVALLSAVVRTEQPAPSLCTLAGELAYASEVEGNARPKKREKRNVGHG